MLVIYEVRNTFGEMRAYVMPVQEGESSQAGLRQYQKKEFYVSPFLTMSSTYHFRVSPPDDWVKIRILQTDHDRPLFAATFSGEKRALSSRALLRACIGLPLVTLKVIAAIHWQALQLWLKGVVIVPRPNAADARRNGHVAAPARPSI